MKSITRFNTVCVITTILIIINIIFILLLIINKSRINYSYEHFFDKITNNINYDTKTQHKNLVFTSAGNNTNFHNLWCNKNRNYDVWVVYYGDNEDKLNLYKDNVDFIIQRKGSKFQNFHYIYNKYRDKIDKYERYFILDDDIIFDTNDINKMFDISEKYNFWLCGPTFKGDGSGKISHQITTQVPNNFLRYCNFVEVNVPLFNKYGLTQLMKYYDPILIGWGIDYLYIWALTNNKSESEYNRKIALVDYISCINPHDKKKNNNRELNNIPDVDKRAHYWDIIKKKLKIEVMKQVNYKSVKK